MQLKEYLRTKQKIVDKYLKKYMGQKTTPPVLGEAIRYSLLAPGKRIRPILMIAVTELLGGSAALAMPVACAIEMVHVYSLIHDDLPAMDDDDLRRGRPTNHKVFGEGLAILAGDTLQAEAFNLIVQRSDVKKLGAKKILMVIRELGDSCGIKGMASGQALDLQSENKKIKLTALRQLHELKTGRLIRGSVRIGAILAGANAQELKSLTKYAEHLGLAFQIQDDLLDEEGETRVLGKKAGADRRKGKATYPLLIGLAAAKKLLEKEIRAAKRALTGFGKKAGGLSALADYVKERRK